MLLAYKINYPDSFFFSEEIIILIEFMNFMLNVKENTIFNHEKPQVAVYKYSYHWWEKYQYYDIFNYQIFKISMELIQQSV